MLPKFLHIDITLAHAGRTKKAEFSGYAYIDSGFLQGELLPTTDTISRSEAVLLTAFTLTGCPIAARTPDPCLNPWSATNGEYKGLRTLTATNFSARSRIAAKPDRDGIAMNLRVEVDGELPRLTGIEEPFQEKISQAKLGTLIGLFEAAFRDERGERLTVKAETEYKLPIDTAVLPVWRNITISGFYIAPRFVQVEQIDLFGRELDAREDLSAKILVAGRAAQDSHFTPHVC
jgi:hypothetical protein